MRVSSKTSPFVLAAVGPCVPVDVDHVERVTVEAIDEGAVNLEFVFDQGVRDEALLGDVDPEGVGGFVADGVGVDPLPEAEDTGVATGAIAVVGGGVAPDEWHEQGGEKDDQRVGVAHGVR